MSVLHYPHFGALWVDVGTEVILSHEPCNWNPNTRGVSVVGEHGLSEWFTERTRWVPSMGLRGLLERVGRMTGSGLCAEDIVKHEMVCFLQGSTEGLFEWW